MAGFLNPVYVGLLAGFGAALGELTGYLIGYGTEKVVLKKNKTAQEWKKKIDFYFKKYHPTLILFAFAALPLPFDVAGIACGAINYPAEKFFLATLAGKLVKYFIIAFAGYYSVSWIASMFGMII